jgi:hypothetical protein
MKSSRYLLLVVGLALIVGGAIGWTLSSRQEAEDYISYESFSKKSIQMPVATKGYNMMGYTKEPLSGDVLPIEDLIEEVEAYLNYFDDHLKISDIFMYEDTEYYFSVVEEETGRGVLELLVN